MSNTDNSKKARALIIDDSVVIRSLTKVLLENLGMDVDDVSNGRDGLLNLKSIRYDIIFLDVKMPEMDGYQVCKRIKSQQTTKGIPVIMLTGQDGTFDKMKGKMAGCDAYLTKPVNLTEVTETVRKFVVM